GVPLEIELTPQSASERRWKDVKMELVTTLSGTDEEPLWGTLAVFAPDTATAFVVDSGDARVKETSPRGALLNVFGTVRGEGPNEFLNPSDVVIKSGTVFIADGMAQRVSAYSRSGELLATLRSPVPSMTRIAFAAGISKMYFLAS